jgi:glycosyltransferase involved in cell wall biosynthesis
VNHVDYALATGNPYSSFEAARLLSGLIGVPYSVDYRDPWTIDVFTGRVDNADRATTEAEREIVTAADFCFQVNPAIAEAYSRKLPEAATKQVVVLNGYDADSIPPPAVRAKGALRFGILGTLNDKWPIDSIFKAWTDIRSQLPSGSTLVLGGNLGYFEGNRELLEAYLPDESVGFHYVGPVPKAEVAAFYAGMDVVLVPIPGGPLVTSGKIFEAMATGRPLVCVQQSDGGGRSLVEDWPLAFGCDPDPESIAAAILKAARSAQHLDPEVSRAVQIRALDYERTRTIAVMVDSVASRVASTTRT